jgi:hypothetical protein
VWTAIKPSGFSTRITREGRVKPSGPDLMGGHWPLFDPLDRHLPWWALTPER